MRGLSRQRAWVGQCSRTAVAEKPIVPYKLYIVSLVTLLDAVHTDSVSVCCITSVTPVEVVHGIAGVTGDLVQALAPADCLLYGILIVHYFIIFHGDVDAGCQKQTAKAIVEDLVTLQGSRGMVCYLYACCEAIEDAVLTQDGMAVGADEHASLCIPKNVILLK